MNGIDMNELLYLNEMIELKSSTHNFKKGLPDGTIRRHPLLPARSFMYNGVDANVTEQDLDKMAYNLNNTRVRKPVTFAHPDLVTADAEGWILPGTAEVSSFEDTKALYVNIEWGKKAEDKITSKKLGYISPVFSMSTINEKGDDIGPSILAAGVLNVPHWSSDQPELWLQFINSQLTSAAKAVLSTPKGDPTMDEIKMANAEIVKLQASVDDLMAKNKVLTDEAAKIKATSENEVMQFSQVISEQKTTNDALKARLEELEASSKREKGENLIQKFQASGHVQEKHLVKDGKDTVLKTFAFENPEAFIEIASMMTPVNLPTKLEGSSEGVVLSFQQKLMNKTDEILAADKKAGGKLDTPQAIMLAKMQIEGAE